MSDEMSDRDLAWANVAIACHDDDREMLREAILWYVATCESEEHGWCSLACTMAVLIAALTNNSTAMAVVDTDSGDRLNPDEVDAEFLPHVTALRMITAAGAGDNPMDHLDVLIARIDGQMLVGGTVSVLGQILGGVLRERSGRVAAGLPVPDPEFTERHRP